MNKSKDFKKTGGNKLCCSDDCCVEEVEEMIKKLVRVFQLFERDQIKIHGVTSTQGYCLLEIYKQGNLTMNEISQKMNLDSSTLTRVIDKLVRDELITRGRDEKDRRIVSISLTAKGEETAKKLSESIGAYYKKIIDNIPEGQMNTIFASMSTLMSAFEAANPNCC